MKLSPITFIIFGICICLVCLTFGYVTWKPNSVETKLRNDNKDLADQEASKEGAAKKRVASAVKEIEAEGQRWQAIAMTKTPPPDLRGGGIDISRSGNQLIVDSRQFRDSIQTAVNKQLRVGGVRLVGDGPYVLDPSESPSTILADYYNYPAIPFPVVIFDLGTINVTGSYEQIMANVRAWSNMPNYLAVADGLRIAGTSPHMTGSYQVSLVGYIHGTKLFTTLPETPGASGAGGGAAGGRGGLGGPPGQQMSLGKQNFMKNGAPMGAGSGR
ncbi:MAG: hypothetical protein ACYC96_07785 [Fimbriimonadaceae bacterium]